MGLTALMELTALMVLAALSAWPVLAAPPAAPAGDDEQLAQGVGSASRRELELMRQRGDLRSERIHVWNLLARLTDPADTDEASPAGMDDQHGADTREKTPRPRFESWYGEDAAFATTRVPRQLRGIRGFARGSSDERVSSEQGPSSENDAAFEGSLAPQSADTPVLAYTLYNRAAYDHIRTHRLYLQTELNRLRATGAADPTIVGERSVAPFPAAAIVLKTVWWPIARDGVTALPVWDSDRNPPRRGGNDYTTWPRVVAVDPVGNGPAGRTAAVDFAGQRFDDAHRVRLQQFYHVSIDRDLAMRLNRDPSASKLAMFVLGRALKAGDFLVLVGTNLATKEISDWVWATLWWHDAADQGPFAADRPPALRPEWRHYLLRVAFDANRPAAADGGPHVCFNPWLEGRFPDGGHGGGTVSNCMSCHRRASYPKLSFLPVTRGAPDVGGDAAYAPGRLRTNFIWAIALHARP